MKIEFTLNGKAVEVEVPADRRILDVIRENLRLIGTKEGCGRGSCGSCLILLDEELVPSCLIPAFRAVGRHITTVEGVQEERLFQRLEQQVGPIIHQGACKEGLMMTLFHLIPRIDEMTRTDFVDALAGNICHCSNYAEIYDRVRKLRTQRNRPWRGRRDASRFRPRGT